MTHYRTSGHAIPAMRRVRKIHFVGIGGSGMNGIAEVLLNQGYAISGSDLVQSWTTDRLSNLGVHVVSKHSVENINGADVVVMSSAIPNSNPEIIEARRRHIPVVSRAEMLGELMRYRFGIAVAGTHGKTTTTSLIASIFQAADLDPTYVIGGVLKGENRNAKLEDSRYLIAEADESDASFLFLQPMVAVITNIDRDHMDTYDQDFVRLHGAFAEFTRRLPFYGVAVMCVDDRAVRELMVTCLRPVVTYGLSEDADYRAVDIEADGKRWRYRAIRPNGMKPLQIELPLPGMHNVANSLAAVAVACEECVPDEKIRKGLSSFSGVERRFEIHDLSVKALSVTMVDDYGHHPSEVREVFKTARHIWPDRRVVMVFQPHRYTRTRDLFQEFVTVLSDADVLIVVSTYSAGESLLKDANAESLVHAIGCRNPIKPIFAPDNDTAIQLIKQNLRERDVLIVQGAGNVSQISAGLSMELSS